MAHKNKGRKIRPHNNYNNIRCLKCNIFLRKDDTTHVCKPPPPNRNALYAVVHREWATATRPHAWGPWPRLHSTKKEPPFLTYEPVPPQFKRKLRCQECGREYRPPNGDCPGSPDGRPYRDRARDARLAARARGDQLYAVHLMGADAPELEPES